MSKLVYVCVGAYVRAVCVRACVLTHLKMYSTHQLHLRKISELGHVLNINGKPYMGRTIAS